MKTVLLRLNGVPVAGEVDQVNEYFGYLTCDDKQMVIVNEGDREWSIRMESQSVENRYVFTISQRVREWSLDHMQMSIDALMKGLMNG